MPGRPCKSCRCTPEVQRHPRSDIDVQVCITSEPSNPWNESSLGGGGDRGVHAHPHNGLSHIYHVLAEVPNPCKLGGPVAGCPGDHHFEIEERVGL